jgi:hypothetical protein
VSGDWLDELTPDERDAFDEFAEHFRRDALHKIDSSAFVMQLVPRGEVDVKFALELGASIMLDKPMLAVVMPGAHVPARLRRCVDVIIEADLDTTEGQRIVALAIAEFRDDA